MVGHRGLPQVAAGDVERLGKGDDGAQVQRSAVCLCARALCQLVADQEVRHRTDMGGDGPLVR